MGLWKLLHFMGKQCGQKVHPNELQPTSRNRMGAWVGAWVAGCVRGWVRACLLMEVNSNHRRWSQMVIKMRSATGAEGLVYAPGRFAFGSLLDDWTVAD